MTCSCTTSCTTRPSKTSVRQIFAARPRIRDGSEVFLREIDSVFTSERLLIEAMVDVIQLDAQEPGLADDAMRGSRGAAIGLDVGDASMVAGPARPAPSAGTA